MEIDGADPNRVGICAVGCTISSFVSRPYRLVWTEPNPGNIHLTGAADSAFKMAKAVRSPTHFVNKGGIRLISNRQIISVEVLQRF